MTFARALGRVVLAMALATVSTGVQAQGEAAPKVDGASGQEDWKTLSTRFNAARAELEKMRKEFDTATPARQIELQTAAAKPIKDVKETYTKLQAMAEAEFEKNPKDSLAAKITLERAFQSKKYDEAMRISEIVLGIDPDDQLALNLGGAAAYISHDFKKAKQILGHAADKQLLIQDYAPMYENADDYIGYWEKEQKIRAAEDAAEGDKQLPRVEMETTKGKIVIELFENEAPNTVANFISLVEKKFYDGLKFHRVIPMFMAQGGCPNTREGASGVPGTGGPGYVIKCECYEPQARLHFTGSLSMAHAGKDTGGSQFFLTHLPTSHLNPDAAAQRGHTVFGRVVEGLDVMQSLQKEDEIQSVKVLRKRNHEYKPETLPDVRQTGN